MLLATFSIFYVKKSLPKLNLFKSAFIALFLSPTNQHHMASASFLKFFLPKDKVFFQLFEGVAETVMQMGIKLKEVVHEKDFEMRAVFIKEIEDMEHTNDEYTHRIFTELGRNFITPFDREDIHALASALDDVSDYIYATAKK